MNSTTFRACSVASISVANRETSLPSPSPSAELADDVGLFKSSGERAAVVVGNS